MKVGLLQFDVAQFDPPRNQETISRLVSGAELDLLVLPELCTTGYLLDPARLPDLATEAKDSGFRFFLQLAQRLQSVVVAGVLEHDDGRFFNTALVVGPQGYIGKQRKLHLTRLERTLFDAGTDIEVFSWPDFSFGVVTCFDAWFPEISRSMTRRGAQLLLQPAAFGGPRTLGLMRTRAIENRVFALTANRIGCEARGDLHVSFLGHSSVWDPEGDVVGQLDGTEALLVCEVLPHHADKKANVMCDDLRAEWERHHVLFS